MKIWVAHNSNYGEHPIEYLAELIHENAAVAWDRDMCDVELEPDPQGVYPVLRFNHGYNGTWVAFSGKMGQIVAYWSKDGRWIPHRTEIGVGERPHVLKLLKKGVKY